LIFGSRVIALVNGFYGSSSLCKIKISASPVELGFDDDFSDSRYFVFINDFSVNSSLCAQKMSASDVELGFLDDFWVPGFKFFQTFLSQQ